jgi:hypothetical protein
MPEIIGSIVDSTQNVNGEKRMGISDYPLPV